MKHEQLKQHFNHQSKVGTGILEWECISNQHYSRSPLAARANNKQFNNRSK
jgi:hypothetical protein